MASSTTRGQRLIIWVITIVMTVGTLGSFFIYMIAANNGPVSDPKQEELMKQYQEQFEKQQKAQAERQAKMRPLEGYNAEAFDAAAVTELRTEDIAVGEGKDATANSTISANYFGWTADGKIFDSTNIDGTLTPAEFNLAEVIKGWTEGLTGAKEGSIRKLVIPADKAYGSSPQPGQPAGPLTFIVEVKSVK